MESKLKESQDSVVTLNAKLENLKKSIKMLNSGSSKLDEILAAGRSDKDRFGLGYTRQTGSGQAIFVKATSSEVSKEDIVKGNRPIETPVRTPTVMKSEKASVTTPIRT